MLKNICFCYTNFPYYMVYNIWFCYIAVFLCSKHMFCNLSWYITLQPFSGGII